MKIRGQQVYQPQERVKRLSRPDGGTGCWNWIGVLRSNPAGMKYGRLVIGSRSDAYAKGRIVSAFRPAPPASRPAQGGGGVIGYGGSLSLEVLWATRAIIQEAGDRIATIETAVAQNEPLVAQMQAQFLMRNLDEAKAMATVIEMAAQRAHEARKR